MRHIGYSRDRENIYADYELENFYDDALIARRLGAPMLSVVRVRLSDEEIAAVNDLRARVSEADRIIAAAQADERKLIDTIARDTERMEGGADEH